MPEDDENYIDIKKKVVLSPEDLDFAKENPAGLTKEGVEEELRNWKMSSNRYKKRMFEWMLVNCKNLTASGKTVDDRPIFARKKGKITWSGQPIPLAR